MPHRVSAGIVVARVGSSVGKFYRDWCDGSNTHLMAALDDGRHKETVQVTSWCVCVRAPVRPFLTHSHLRSDWGGSGELYIVGLVTVVLV